MSNTPVLGPPGRVAASPDPGQDRLVRRKSTLMKPTAASAAKTTEHKPKVTATDRPGSRNAVSRPSSRASVITSRPNSRLSSNGDTIGGIKFNADNAKLAEHASKIYGYLRYPAAQADTPFAVEPDKATVLVDNTQDKPRVLSGIGHTSPDNLWQGHLKKDCDDIFKFDFTDNSTTPPPAVCLMVIGSTHSGKTTLMFGEGDQKGVAHHIVEDFLAGRGQRNTVSTLLFSLLEIVPTRGHSKIKIEEEIVDLLNVSKPKTLTHSRRAVLNGLPAVFELDGTRFGAVNSTEGFTELVNKARDLMSVSENTINKASSRGCVILDFRVVYGSLSEYEAGKSTNYTNLTLCVLPGYEPNVEGWGGQTSPVNLSLVNLGTAFRGLSEARQKQLRGERLQTLPALNDSTVAKHLLADLLNGAAVTFVVCVPADQKLAARTRSAFELAESCHLGAAPGLRNTVQFASRTTKVIRAQAVANGFATKTESNLPQTTTEMENDTSRTFQLQGSPSGLTSQKQEIQPVRTVFDAMDRATQKINAALISFKLAQQKIMSEFIEDVEGAVAERSVGGMSVYSPFDNSARALEDRSWSFTG